MFVACIGNNSSHSLWVVDKQEYYSHFFKIIQLLIDNIGEVCQLQCFTLFPTILRVFIILSRIEVGKSFIVH